MYSYFKNKSQEFRSKNVDERRNYFLKKIEQNHLNSQTYKKVCTTLSYIKLWALQWD